MIAGQKNRKRKISTMAAGVLCLVLAAALLLYNLWDGERARRASDAITAGMEQAILDETHGEGAETAQNPDLTQEVSETRGASGKMPTKLIDGYACIGELEIPSINLILPVLADWNEDFLKVSPCRYSGSYLTNDLVVCGHNYLRHFSPIKWLDIGAEVNLITADGQVLHYLVSNLETVKPAAIDAMIKNSSNAQLEGVTSCWDLTLFTCTTGGRARCAVRCVKAAA